MSAIVLGPLYAIALIAATPFAYARTLWLNASDRGWRTQAAVGGLIIEWLALAVGAVIVWQAVNAKRRPNLKAVVPSSWTVAQHEHFDRQPVCSAWTRTSLSSLQRRLRCTQCGARFARLRWTN